MKNAVAAVTSLGNRTLRWVVSRTISGCFTGKTAGLRRLISLARRVPGYRGRVAARRFFDLLSASVDKNDAMARLFLRIGRQLSTVSRRKVASNLIYNEFLSGYGCDAPAARTGTGSPVSSS